MRKLLLIGSLICVMFLAVSANANLLVDPGFEANPLNTANNVLNNIAANAGDWGDESSTITGAVGGVTPPEGVRMLSMTNAGGVATQTFQATDVTSYAVLIDSGSAIVNLSALFDIDSPLTTATGSVAVYFLSTDNWSAQLGSPLASGLALDADSGTWQLASLSGSIPVNTRWLVTQVAYNNSSLQAADGAYYPGYVDAADLTVVPEPATLLLLGMGGLALRRRK